MANFWYTRAKRDLFKADLDFDTIVVEVILVMTNTTAAVDDGTGRDAATISAITLDEYDGSGYVAGYGNRKTLANQAITEDAVGNLVKFDADDVTYVDLGAGTRQCQAALLSKKGPVSDVDSVPLFYYDTGGFPFDGTGVDEVIQWNASGIATGVDKT